jgi:hypothetical protein
LLSDVCDPVILGSAEVLQHIPRAVTAAPPSFEIKPPVVAELTVISVTAVVVNVGITGSFLQLLVIKIPKMRQTNARRAIFLFMLNVIKRFNSLVYNNLSSDKKMRKNIKKTIYHCSIIV